MAMMTTLVLSMPNFSISLVIKTDTSGTRIGEVLTQQERPVAFLNKTLSPQKQACSIYSKEMLAILEAIRVWHTYLIGQ